MTRIITRKLPIPTDCNDYSSFAPVEVPLGSEVLAVKLQHGGFWADFLCGDEAADIELVEFIFAPARSEIPDGFRYSGSNPDGLRYAFYRTDWKSDVQWAAKHALDIYEVLEHAGKVELTIRNKKNGSDVAHCSFARRVFDPISAQDEGPTDHLRRKVEFNQIAEKLQKRGWTL